VQLATIQAIHGHNGAYSANNTGANVYGRGSVAPNLPISSDMIMDLDQRIMKSKLESIIPSWLTGGQLRTCYAHGCVGADAEAVVQLIVRVNTSSVLLEDDGYEGVLAADVLQGYTEGNTLHYLWRLQLNPESTGVYFNIFCEGGHCYTMRVKTKQAYEALYMTLTWIGFAIRMLLFVVSDVYFGNLTCKCTEDSLKIAEVTLDLDFKYSLGNYRNRKYC